MSSGDNLCISALDSSVVLNMCWGVEVAADSKLITIVNLPGEPSFSFRWIACSGGVETYCSMVSISMPVPLEELAL